MSVLARLNARIRIPFWLLCAGILGLVLLSLWTWALASDRNPLPFPDRDYAVFSARSESALIAMEEIMRMHGHRPRFRIDGPEVQRTVFSNGMIVNHPEPAMRARLGDPGAALGLVVEDPEASARAVAELLQAQGFSAQPIFDAEPGLPIAFVSTDALHGSAIVFRKHVLEMGAKPDVWTPRR
jgi:hypothetical protein